MRRQWLRGSLSGLLLLVADANARELNILTSFLPLYCFTANVAGNSAKVEMLLPPNVEPHDYQLAVKDRARIEKADLIILHGLGLDNWLEPALARSKAAVLVVSSAVADQLIVSGGSPTPNPHLWLDPILAIRCVTNIVIKLGELDPQNAGSFQANGSNYIARLRALDQQLGATLEPVRGQSLVTFHDSFPYFARRYGLNVAGVIERVPEVSPSPRYLADLYKVIRKTGARCIFIEPQFRSSIAQMVAEDLDLPIAALNPLESGPANPRGYEVGMEENARTLLQKLK
jgi:zinc transport system substrate-binding protein